MTSHVGILKAFDGKSGNHVGICRVPINRALLRVTVVIGIGMWIPSLLLYQRTINPIGRPVVIGLLFSLLYLAVIIVVFLTSKLTNNYIGNVTTMKRGVSKVFLLLLSGLAFVFSLGALLEWVYELNIDAADREPTSYVFVIDDSGSMSGNDPEQRRYAAIGDVLDGVDPSFPFMVYEFASDVSVLREMAPLSEGFPAMRGMQDGGTAMKAALNAVLDDHERGEWSGGNRPKVILLSDGAPTDLGFLDTLNAEMKRYARAGVSISTVGLGDADEQMMRRIARATGGVYVAAPDAGSLSDAMAEAAVESAERDLLSARHFAEPDLLYVILRILFLAILGIAIGIFSAIAYGSADSVALIVASSAAQSFMGGFMFEIAVGVLGVPSELAWALLWLLIATTVAIDRRHDGMRQEPWVCLVHSNHYGWSTAYGGRCRK